MKKGSLSLLFVLAVVVLLAVGCAPATPAATAKATEAPTEVMTEKPTEAVSAMPTECETEGACAVFAPGEPIRIGVAGPLSGDNSAYGQDIQNSALLVAAAAGDFHGHTFEIVAEDDLGTPDGGSAVANKFASDPTIVAVVGHAFSGASAAAIPIYTDANIPMLTPSATNPALTQDGNTVFNRAVATDAVQGQFVAEYIYKALGAKKLAITHDSTTYGQGLAEIVQKEFTAMGGEVVLFEAITPGETDYSAVLALIADAKPDAYFHGGYTSEWNVLARQRGAAGLGDLPFICGDGCLGTQIVDLAGEAAEGLYSSGPVAPLSDARTVFDAAYLEAYGIEAGALSAYSWKANDATAAAIATIEATAVVGDDGTVYIVRAKLVDAFRHISGFKGLTGEITCDETGECAKGGFTMSKVTDGKFVVQPSP